MSDEEPPMGDHFPDDTAAFVNFVAHMNDLAAQAASVDHTNCSVDSCSHKAVAVIKTNAKLLDELRLDVKRLDQKLDEALVDLAPVQALIETVKLLSAEVEKLRKEKEPWKPKTRKLKTPADDPDAYDDTFLDTPADDPDAYDDTYGYACAHVDYFNG